MIPSDTITARVVDTLRIVDTTRVVDTAWVAVPQHTTTFLEQFWPNLAATFVGAVLGVLGALWLDRQIAAAKQRAGRRTVLEAYRHAVNDNLALLDQILQMVKPTNVVFFTLDVGLFDSLADNALEVIGDVPFLQSLNGFRYQLAHLARKLDLDLQASHGAARAFSGWHQIHETLVKTILEHAAILKGTGEELRNELDNRLAAMK